MAAKQRALEAHIQEVTNQRGPSMFVPWFLILSYAYYHLDISPVRDEWFDRMCKTMLAAWDAIKHHHKHLISREDLEAGTGYAIKEYPQITIGACQRVLLQYGFVRRT